GRRCARRRRTGCARPRGGAWPGWRRGRRRRWSRGGRAGRGHLTARADVSAARTFFLYLRYWRAVRATRRSARPPDGLLPGATHVPFAPVGAARAQMPGAGLAAVLRAGGFQRRGRASALWLVGARSPSRWSPFARADTL